VSLKEPGKVAAKSSLMGGPNWKWKNEIRRIDSSNTASDTNFGRNSLHYDDDLRGLVRLDSFGERADPSKSLANSVLIREPVNGYETQIIKIEPLLLEELEKCNAITARFAEHVTKCDLRLAEED